MVRAQQQVVTEVPWHQHRNHKGRTLGTLRTLVLRNSPISKCLWGKGLIKASKRVSCLNWYVCFPMSSKLFKRTLGKNAFFARHNIRRVVCLGGILAVLAVRTTVQVVAPRQKLSTISDFFGIVEAQNIFAFVST